MSFTLPSIRTYLLLTAALLMNEAASYAGYVMPHLGSALFIGIIIAALILSWRRLEWGLAVVLAELFVGGKGYLYQADISLHALHVGTMTISIRIALFCILFAVWLIRYRARTSLMALPRTIRWSLGALGIATLWGVVHGILAHHGLQAVFLDANAYLFFLLLIILMTPDVDWRRFGPTVLGLIAAAATVLGLKSVLSLGMFAHLSISGLAEYYRWIRNTGVGEIAYISGNSYRVFFQSQIYGLFALCILAPFVLPHSIATGRRPWWMLAPMTFGLIAVLVSLSRSFWLGGAIALALGAVVGWIRYRWSLKQISGIVAVAVALFFVAYTATSWALNFPYPYAFSSHNSSTSSLIKQRFEHFGGEAAASSRLQMVQPLLTAIKRNPLFGSGYATMITYQSNDPRQVQSASHGIYTTDAFELGYLDMTVKVGILGLLCYLALLGALVVGLWRLRTPLAFGMLLAVIAVAGVHLTTPYLNHPLGIGLLLIALVVAFGHAPREVPA